MHELFDKLSEFVWGVSRYRWTALAVAWTLALVGWLMVAQVDSKYPATARLFVDTNRVLGPLLEGIAVQSDVKKQVALMSKTLLSRPNIEKLIEKNNLDAEIFDDGGYENLIESLQDQIEIYDTNGTKSLYALEYSNIEPDKALSVVDSLVDIFINSSLEEERNDNVTAISFIDTQIEDYEQRLAAAEQRLADFKQKHAGTLPGEQGGYYQRMEHLVTQQRNSELSYQEALNQRNSLRQQLTQVESNVMSAASQTTPEDIRIEELRNNLDELLVRFTDRHPQVSILRESIADLERSKRNNTASLGDRNSILQESVVYQKISTLLAEAEAEVAKLGARTSTVRSRVNDLRGTVDSIPLVEAELVQLDRDYNTVNERYQALLSKREAARLTGSVERDSNDVKIRLIDPPFVPSRPTDPDKLLLNALVLFGSIVAGIAVGFFLSLLHPVFYNRRALEHYTSIPVLGGVSMSQKASGRFDNTVSNLNFGILAILLPVVFGGLLYMQVKNSPIYDSLKINAFSGTKTVSLLDQ